MALYIPPARRRRRLVLVSAATLLIGLVVGVLVGRATTTSTAERITEVRTEANDIATRLQALSIEYEQALTGKGDTVQGGVLAALDGIDRDTARAVNTASWLTAANRTEVENALNQVRASAEAKVDAQSFADQLAEAASVIHRQLGDEGQ
jgi:hypothetical protein